MKHIINFRWNSILGCIFKIKGNINYSPELFHISEFTGVIEVSCGNVIGIKTYTFAIENRSIRNKYTEDLLIQLNKNQEFKFTFTSNNLEVPVNMKSNDFLKNFNKKMSFLNSFNMITKIEPKLVSISVN